MTTAGELQPQLDQAVTERNWTRVLLLARELLFGEPGMSAPNSPAAIRALGTAHEAGYRPAGFELAGIPFEVVSGLVSMTEAEWLALMIENARSGDIGAILDVEHLPERLLSREDAAEIGRQGRAASQRNVVDLR